MTFPTLRCFLFSALLSVLAAPAGLSAAAPEPPVTLTPYVVKDNPINSYAFDLVVGVDKASHRIVRLLITAVADDSDAARAGLKPGDEIVKINGLSLAELGAPFGPDSELNRLLLNRPPGEPLRLEVVTRRTLDVILRAAAVAPSP